MIGDVAPNRELSYTSAAVAVADCRDSNGENENVESKTTSPKRVMPRERISCSNRTSLNAAENSTRRTRLNG